MHPGKQTFENKREKLYAIIFESDTVGGKRFDIALIITIMLSVIVVMVDSVSEINETYGSLLYFVEWFFTILFSIEYILRLISIGKPAHYAKSFFGIIDLLSILPTYVSLFIPGSQNLIAIRILRVLRIFRILKLVQYMYESRVLMRALHASRRKIEVFLFTVLILAIIFGSLMYLIEGEENGFTSIPRGVYWAIVTLTTVGYGDISPKTGPGQALAAVIMIMGYGIIAVPTGIVTVELSHAGKREHNRVCSECSTEIDDPGAKYCKNCGWKL